ncbi:MAG: hypothetical protein H0T46_08485 [Deltaproteobacteria bacterium]|nr:hypothetical protein [Deltaproteobacteria bacterium]
MFEPAVWLRRAELLDRLGRIDEARDELARAIAVAPDAEMLATKRLLDASSAARRGSPDDLARVLAAAPLPERPRLSHRAVADAAPGLLAALAAAGPELAIAAGVRLEELHGPAGALAAREEAARMVPDDADVWDALARSRVAAGDVDGALEAWDRAIANAPAQPAFRIAPIRALVLAGVPDRARQRAGKLAAEARSARSVELLVAASSAASAIDRELAVALARDAQALRPRDGRLAFLVAQRLADAGDTTAAARAYADLLICGAHGRAWHRHEVAAKLRELGAAARSVLDEKSRCETVEPGDLEQYTSALRAIR